MIGVKQYSNCQVDGVISSFAASGLPLQLGMDSVVPIAYPDDPSGRLG